MVIEVIPQKIWLKHHLPKKFSSVIPGIKSPPIWVSPPIVTISVPCWPLLFVTFILITPHWCWILLGSLRAGALVHYLHHHHLQHLAKWLIHCKHLLHKLILACDFFCVFLFTAPTVLLFTLPALFVEPCVGKVWAKRREEDTRSHRNCRQVTLSWLAWQLEHSLSPGWCCSCSNSHNNNNSQNITSYSSAAPAQQQPGPSRWSSYRHFARKQILTQRVAPDTHARCYKRAQGLLVIFYKMWGERAYTGHLG